MDLSNKMYLKINPEYKFFIISLTKYAQKIISENTKQKTFKK